LKRNRQVKNRVKGEKVKRERLKMQGTRRRVKMQKEGIRITDYGLGGKIKKLRAECNGLESLDAGRRRSLEAL